MKRRDFFKTFGVFGALTALAVIPKDVLKAKEPDIEFKEVPKVSAGEKMQASIWNGMSESIKQLQAEVKRLRS